MSSLYRFSVSTLTRTDFKKNVLKEFNLFPALTSMRNLEESRREMSRVKHRKTHPFYWWAKKRRERNDQEITGENQNFINQAVVETRSPLYIPQTSGMPVPLVTSPLKEIVTPRSTWSSDSIRTGLIARKIGVYPMWLAQGRKISVSLLQVVDNHVIRYLSPEECQQNYGRRFGALGILIVGAESADPQLFTKDYCGLFNEAGTLPKLKLNRFTVTPDAALQPGTPLYASHFQVGQYVDVAGLTRERGFQGVMHRWGFKGNRASHGVTKSHRRPGCIGGGGEKGRVWPGQKMPGHVGGARRTHFGMKILRINTKYNVIFVRGEGVPGEVGKFVTIRDTFVRDKKFVEAPAFPTFYPEEHGEPLPDEILDTTLHSFDQPTLTYEERK